MRLALVGSMIFFVLLFLAFFNCRLENAAKMTPRPDMEGGQSNLIEGYTSLWTTIGDSQGNIFFIETNENVTSFDARILAAFESAAKLNPDMQVKCPWCEIK